MAERGTARFVTIEDVARDANCSTATVSRALNSPWKVNAATRKRVQASVARLGYRPNVRARLLARGTRSGSICFLLSNRQFMHAFHARILQGASDRAEAMRLQVLFACCNYSPVAPPAKIDLPHILSARGVIDGVIVAGTNYPNILHALDGLGLPYVIFGTNFIAGDETYVSASVHIDDEDGGYQAASHLLEQGHKKVRFIGDVSVPWYRRRYLGYARAMTEAGLPCDPPTGSAYRGEMEMGFSAAADLFDRGVEFTALFVAGDVGAVGAVRALKSRGLSVPEDISVVGFNDEEAARLCEPPLTTVATPTEVVGSECVNMLHSLLTGSEEKIEPVVLRTELVVRESTRKESRNGREAVSITRG
ncbi:MAG: LacI family DNA-binding transcriptional regulator [Armatimonadetes bacterium]|nr:LacI family DNA-binding transcriptional regulator [Armatimonadota bacterium]